MGMFAEFAWSRSNRLLIALAYCNAFAALGACLAAFGPVLLELAIQTNASLRDTGYCFIVRSFGYFLGSFTGILYDHLPGNLVLGSVVVVAGAASAIIPHINNVMVLGGVVLFQGAGMGACDTGANLMLIYLYGSDVAPYMQLLHASFAVGAFSSPLLLRAVEGSSDTHTHTGLAGAGSYAPAFYLIAMYTMAVGLGVLFLKSPRSRTGASTRDVASSSSSSSGFAVAGDKGAVDAVSSNGHGDASGPAAGNGNEVVMVLQETGQNHHMGQLPLALQPLSMPLGGDVTAGGNVGNNNGQQRGPPVVFATLAGREHDNAALHASSNISTPGNGLTQADAAATAAWSSSDAPFSAQLESLSSVSTSSGSTLPGGYSSGDSGSGDSSANNSVAGSVVDRPPQLPAGFNVGREVWIAVAIVAVFLGICECWRVCLCCCLYLPLLRGFYSVASCKHMRAANIYALKQYSVRIEMRVFQSSPMYCHLLSVCLADVGMETGFGGFVTSFGVISLGMTEGEGQLLAGKSRSWY